MQNPHYEPRATFDSPKDAFDKKMVHFNSNCNFSQSYNKK